MSPPAKLTAATCAICFLSVAWASRISINLQEAANAVHEHELFQGLRAYGVTEPMIEALATLIQEKPEDQAAFMIDFLEQRRQTSALTETAGHLVAHGPLDGLHTGKLLTQLCNWFADRSGGKGPWRTQLLNDGATEMQECQVMVRCRKWSGEYTFRVGLGTEVRPRTGPESSLEWESMPAKDYDMRFVVGDTAPSGEKKKKLVIPLGFPESKEGGDRMIESVRRAFRQESAEVNLEIEVYELNNQKDKFNKVEFKLATPTSKSLEQKFEEIRPQVAALAKKDCSKTSDLIMEELFCLS